MNDLVKICPSCGSTNVKVPPRALGIKMTKQDYCTDCEFWGSFPEIEETTIEKFRKNLSHKSAGKRFTPP